MQSGFEAAAGRELVAADLFRARVIERVHDNEVELPILSRAMSELLALCQADESTATEISRIIHRDWAIAGHLMRVVNSPAFAGRRSIGSLEQAVARLGVRLVGVMATAVAAQSSLFRVAGREGPIARMWRHSTLTAGFAQEIARLSGRNAETAFFCGLLHDVGKPVALGLVDDIARETGEPCPAEVTDELIDELHEVLGARLAKRWALPKPLVASVFYHHEWRSAGTHRDFVLTTTLAHRLAYHVDDSSSPDEPPESDDFAELNLYRDEVESLWMGRQRVMELANALA